MGALHEGHLARSGAPTPDGVAVSSRNAYHASAERRAASVLYRARAVDNLRLDAYPGCRR